MQFKIGTQFHDCLYPYNQVYKVTAYQKKPHGFIDQYNQVHYMDYMFPTQEQAHKKYLQRYIEGLEQQLKQEKEAVNWTENRIAELKAQLKELGD